MKEIDYISELYYGNLRPCDMCFHDDTRFGAAIDAFQEQKTWLEGRLAGQERDRFDELSQCHYDIVDTMARENFQVGFQLGLLLMSDATHQSRDILEAF